MPRSTLVVVITMWLPLTVRAQGAADSADVVRELAMALRTELTAGTYVIAFESRPGHRGLDPALLDSLALALKGVAGPDHEGRAPLACPWDTATHRGYSVYVDAPQLDDSTATLNVGFQCSPQNPRVGGFAKDVDYLFQKTPSGWRFTRSRVIRVT